MEESGTYSVTVTLTLENQQTVEASAEPVSVTIDPAQISFTAILPENAVYNGQAQPAVVTPETEAAVTADDYAVVYTASGAAAQPVGAGTYTVTARLLSPDFVFAGGGTEQGLGSYTIAQKPVQVLWRGLTRVYGQESTLSQTSLSGVLAGDDCTLAGLTDQSNAGSYALTAQLVGADAGNYRLTNADAVLTIQRAPVAFSVTNNAVMYDEMPHEATVTPDVSGFAGFTVEYQPAGGTVVEKTTEPGVYTIRAALTDGNYRHAAADDGEARDIGTLTITERPPQTYTVTYTGEGVTEPADEGLPAGAVLILPDQDREGYILTGWKYDGAVYAAGNTFVMPAQNVTFEAQWEPARGISGTVVTDEDGQLMPGVTVSLKLGAEVLAETQTDEQGGFSFSNVRSGAYNLVGSYNGIVMTIQADVTASDEKNAVIRMPSGKTNSVVEVSPGTSVLTVGYLETVFTEETDVYTDENKATVAEGGTVEVTLTAEPTQNAETVGQQVREAAGSRVTLGMFIDLTVSKAVYNGWTGYYSGRREKYL